MTKKKKKKKNKAVWHSEQYIEKTLKNYGVDKLSISHYWYFPHTFISWGDFVVSQKKYYS